MREEKIERRLRDWLEAEKREPGLEKDSGKGKESSVSLLSAEVFLPAHYSEETVERTRKALELLAEYARLFAAKHEAYGPGNIDGFGELGVLVRLNDKVERLKNLIYKRKHNDLEAIEDTWLDIIGYGLIGLMIRRGRW